MKQRLAVSLAFIAVCFGVAVVPAVVAQVAQQHCCAALASSVVTSLNTLTGDVTLSSPDGSLTISNAGQAIHIVASPMPCPTAGTNVTITGTSLPNCTIAASGGSGGVTLFPSPLPTAIYNVGQSIATIQNGYTQTTGAVIDCNGPSPASPVACPNAIVLANGAGKCESGNYSSLGTSSSSVNTVVGELLALGCPGASPFITMGGHGDIGFGGTIYGPVFAVYGGASVLLWSGTESDNGNCWLQGIATVGIAFKPGGSGTCQFQFRNGPLASSALGLDASLDVVSASTQTTLSGEVTCTVASATSCTTTAVTVRSGAHCTATMESTDSTLAGPYYAPALHNASGSLTIKLTALTSGSGNLAANYWCP